MLSGSSAGSFPLLQKRASTGAAKLSRLSGSSAGSFPLLLDILADALQVPNFQDPLPDRSLCYCYLLGRTARLRRSFRILCRIVPSATHKNVLRCSQQLHFQDPLPDRSLCYLFQGETLTFLVRPFRILCRIVPSATKVDQFIAAQIRSAFRILCRIVPSATAQVSEQNSHEAYFQDPLPDRSLCYQGISFAPPGENRSFQDPLPDRSLCYPFYARRHQSHSPAAFQDPLPDRSLCYAMCDMSAAECNILSGSSAGSFPLLPLCQRLPRQSLAAFRILCRIVPSATSSAS